MPRADRTAPAHRADGTTREAARASLLAELKAGCGEDWRTYIEHPFVRGLGEGTLPRACFEHYLKQDYLFLIQFARAYGLAAFKSQTIEDLREAKAGLAAILDVELGLHVEFCAGWGLSEAELARLPEATATLAYTRYVLERGLAGTLLDLQVALAPCILGYAEIGEWLMAQPFTRRDGNPYEAWIAMYAGSEYQQVARAAARQLERLGAAETSPARRTALARTFRDATRLEIGFWEMALRVSD